VISVMLHEKKFEEGKLPVVMIESTPFPQV